MCHVGRTLHPCVVEEPERLLTATLFARCGKPRAASAIALGEPEQKTWMPQRTIRAVTQIVSELTPVPSLLKAGGCIDLRVCSLLIA